MRRFLIRTLIWSAIPPIALALFALASEWFGGSETVSPLSYSLF